jgi:hypothetical protein
VQVDQQIRIVGRREPALGYLLGLGRVSDPVERLGEQAEQAIMLSRISW